jgi:hypothetical protein
LARKVRKESIKVFSVVNSGDQSSLGPSIDQDVLPLEAIRCRSVTWLQAHNSGVVLAGIRVLAPGLRVTSANFQPPVT